MAEIIGQLRVSAEAMRSCMLSVGAVVTALTWAGCPDVFGDEFLDLLNTDTGREKGLIGHCRDGFVIQFAPSNAYSDLVERMASHFRAGGQRRAAVAVRDGWPILSVELAS